MATKPYDIPPVYFAASAVLMLLLDRSLPGPQLADGSWRWLALLPAAAGVALGIAGAQGFRRAGTAIHPFSEPSSLVTTGPFAYTRNPMYLGLALLLTGWGVWLGSSTPLLVVPLFVALIHNRFILREEPFMAERFGDAYAAYRTRVRRWL